MEPADFAHAREATGPAPVSLWTVLTGFRSDPLQRWSKIRADHGDVARYRFAWADTYLISSPEGAKRVLQDNADNYTKAHPTYRALRQLFGDGLLTSQGDHWLRQRRLAQPAFHKQRIAKMAEQMSVAANDLAREWETAPAPVPLAAEMSRLTLRVVGEALFGLGLAEKSSRVAEAWSVLNRQLAERNLHKRWLPPILPTRYDRDFRHARRSLFSVVDEIVTTRRRNGQQSDDLLSMFMHATDEETGERMDDKQLRDELITMLVAGHETTAVALTWTWILLHVHEAARNALHAELDRVLNGRVAQAADVPQLAYARAVISESMRLHPPAYLMFRRARANDVVCGCRVHAGGSVAISPLVLHRHPDYWDRPDAFMPERWLDDSALSMRPRFAYLPFSAGPRQCIGNAFSMMEATLVLATLAQRFDVRLQDSAIPQTEYAVLARPTGPVLATPVPRGVESAARVTHIGTLYRSD